MKAQFVLQRGTPYPPYCAASSLRAVARAAEENTPSSVLCRLMMIVPLFLNNPHSTVLFLLLLQASLPFLYVHEATSQIVAVTLWRVRGCMLNLPCCIKVCHSHSLLQFFQITSLLFWLPVFLEVFLSDRGWFVAIRVLEFLIFYPSCSISPICMSNHTATT